MATLEDIKGMVNRRGGFARPNRFIVDFSGLKSIADQLQNTDIVDLNFMVDSITMPGRTLTTFDYAIWNHPIRIPGGYSEDDIEIVFTITNDFAPKIIMDAWLALVVNQWTYHAAYASEYKKDFEIWQLDEADKKVYGVKIMGAYPAAVKSLLLDNNSESAVSRFSVTIPYDRFVILNPSNPVAKPISNYVGDITPKNMNIA